MQSDYFIEDLIFMIFMIGCIIFAVSMIINGA